jgi:hypothetical protein
MCHGTKFMPGRNRLQVKVPLSQWILSPGADSVLFLVAQSNEGRFFLQFPLPVVIPFKATVQMDVISPTICLQVCRLPKTMHFR